MSSDSLYDGPPPGLFPEVTEEIVSLMDDAIRWPYLARKVGRLRFFKRRPWDHRLMTDSINMHHSNIPMC